MKNLLFQPLASFFTALGFLSRLPCHWFCALSSNQAATHGSNAENFCEKSVTSPPASKCAAEQTCQPIFFEPDSGFIPASPPNLESNLKQGLPADPEPAQTQLLKLPQLDQLAQINLGKSVAYFPAAGLFLGALAVLPLWVGLGSGHYWLQAWLYVGLMAWLTRGLHWDGLADLADACASFAKGEAFWRIIKDSSLGALGGLALIIIFFGYIIIVQDLIAQGQWLNLIWAAGMGRLACLGLASISQPYSQASLGKIFVHAKPRRWLALWLVVLFALGSFLISWKACAAAIILGSVSVYYLASIARKMGGYNGDFLGAAIVLGELCALAAFLLVI